MFNFTMKGLLDKINSPFMKKIKKTLLKSKQTDQNKLKSSILLTIKEILCF
jgi:hypothetical protein